jgi:hypothetical protein
MLASWKLSLPQVPQRTRLYPLEPVGVGTAMVESIDQLRDAACRGACGARRSANQPRTGSTQALDRTLDPGSLLSFLLRERIESVRRRVGPSTRGGDLSNQSLLAHLPSTPGKLLHTIPFSQSQGVVPSLLRAVADSRPDDLRAPVVERAAGRCLFSSPESFGRNLLPLPKVDEAGGLHLSDGLLW